MPWKELLERNARWAKNREEKDPGLFHRVASEHRPHAMYIGCSDARVPANLVTACGLGELFVHRNIANQISNDASLSAGLQYAVEILGVEDIIICGHHGCGGVAAALSPDEAPDQVEGWISDIRLLARVHRAELDRLKPQDRCERLVQLNVKEQLATLQRHPSVRRAWREGRPLLIHGWVYDLPTGRIKTLETVGADSLPSAGSSPSAEAGVQAK